jgi:hypothetical protein
MGRGIIGGMPQFSIRRLLVGVTLISIGMAACGVALRSTATPSTMTLYYAGGAVVGAGLFTPFKHPILGVVLGFVAAGVILGIGALVVGNDI